MSEERLQKLMARAGIASRRASEALIEAGRVSVNGQVASLGQKADPDADEILIDGVSLPAACERIVIALHKPCGYLSAMHDDRGRACVSELIPLHEHPSLFHVGRLDADTSGLLLFTTDGQLGQRLAHPSHEVMKEYVATVKGTVSEEELACLRRGIKLEDGMTSPAEADLLPGAEPARVRLRIHEGRNRQVRRMMEAIGHPVCALERTAIGDVRLDGLALGTWRRLSDEEVASLIGCGPCEPLQ